MVHCIDKSALVTRIKKLKMDIGNIFNEYDEGFWEGRTTAFDDVICALDTLEVKEVDLDEEIQRILDEHFFYPEEDELKEVPKLIRYVAKYFFELGLKAQKL